LKYPDPFINSIFVIALAVKRAADPRMRRTSSGVWILSTGFQAAKYFNKAFCSHCGSPVPHKARSGDFLIIPAGSLNSDPEVRPRYNIFWENRAVWYDQGCAAKKVSEYPNAF
jgi:hypothetical protein